MVKGRKFNTNRSERLLGTAYTQISTSTEPIELREEDVWSVVEDLGNLTPGEWEPCALTLRRQQQDHRRHLGCLSQAFEDPLSIVATTSSSRVVHQQYRQVATSAPMNVPDWSKILRVESLHNVDDGLEDDESESEMVPPHEYLARGRKIAANSVFEGVGRTLKGRDMRRVRDAVWNQTGFDG